MKIDFQVERIALGVTEQNMKMLGNNELVGDSKNYIYAHFRLPTEWKELTKQVYFNQSATSLYFVLTADGNNSVLIPHELMDHAGEFAISLVGTGDDKRITTNQCVVYVRASNIIPPDNPNVPTVDFLTESVDAVARDRQAVEEDTAHVDEIANGLRQEIDNKLDGAIEEAATNTADRIINNVQRAMDESVTIVNSAKTTAVNTINTAKETAESVITSAKEEAVATVTDIKNNAIGKITSDTTKALSDIELVKTTAEATITSLKTDAISKISGAGTSATNAINSLKNETVAKIESDKNSALAAIDGSKNSALFDIARQQGSVREELNDKVLQARSEANRAEQEANRATDRANEAKQIASELPARVNEYVLANKEILKGGKGDTGDKGDRGEDGKSVTVEQVENGAKVTDGFGNSVTVTNGIDGKDGVIPAEDLAQITENKNKIAEQSAEIVELQKVNTDQQERIEVLEKLSNGVLWDSVTDDTEAYSKAIPKGAFGKATVNSIGGKCIVENQLLADNINVAEKIGTGVTYSMVNGVGVLNGVANGTTRWQFNKTHEDIPILANHKYYLFNVRGANRGDNWYMCLSNNGASLLNVSVSNGGIIVPTTDYLFSQFSVRWFEGTEFNNFEIEPKIVDLTVEWGAGNEPNADFCKQYYSNSRPYNDGEIKSICCDCVEVADTKGNVQQLTIPTETLNLEGYGAGVNGVVNEIDFVNKKYIQRIYKKTITGADVGTSFKYHDGLVKYRINIPYGVKPQDKQDNMLSTDCDIAVQFSGSAFYDNVSFPKMTLCHHNATALNQLYCAKDGFTTKEQYVNYFNENPSVVYYELAEPIEYDVTDLLADFDNVFQAESNGSVTFKNTLGEDYKVPIPNSVSYVRNLKEV